MSTSGKPLPQPDLLSRGFWEGTAMGELRVQKCLDCDHHQFYGRALCVRCGSLDVAWTAVSGRGSVHSFTVIRRTGAPGWRDEVPYVVALIDLAEGPRMLSNVVGCSPDDVEVAMPVEVAFTPADDVVLPLFRPRT